MMHFLSLSFNWPPALKIGRFWPRVRLSRLPDLGFFPPSDSRGGDRLAVPLLPRPPGISDPIGEIQDLTGAEGGVVVKTEHSLVLEI